GLRGALQRCRRRLPRAECGGRAPVPDRHGESALLPTVLTPFTEARGRWGRDLPSAPKINTRARRSTRATNPTSTTDLRARRGDGSVPSGVVLGTPRGTSRRSVVLTT